VVPLDNKLRSTTENTEKTRNKKSEIGYIQWGEIQTDPSLKLLVSMPKEKAASIFEAALFFIQL
jgi:hypothetical protein